MELSKAASKCICTLENAGFEAYAVGGCVRDALLGLTPHDYDLCTNATPAETAELFADFTLVRSGEKHGTVGVVIEGEVIEITTFRTEGGYTDSRHPDWVRFVPTVEEDLSRRDFTVNAMAYNPSRGYIDPFGGQQDLENKILRAVGDPRTRFSEDALRILRGLRFGVRFRLTPEENTWLAMNEMAHLLDRIAKERIFDELCKLLPLVNDRDLILFAPILAKVLPELAPSVGFLQHNPHHKYDVYTHTAKVVSAVPGDLILRWAALLHDCGKPTSFTLDETGRGHFKGHAAESAKIAEAILLNLKAPTALREQVVFLVEKHMATLAADKKLLRRRLGQYGTEQLYRLLSLQEADFGGKGVENGEENPFPAIRTLLAEVLAEDACLTVKDLAINGKDLIEMGIPAGPQIGECLASLLEQVQDEKIPNTRQALLTATQTFL